ncbi:MAG: hypothetical protein AAF711_17600 [Planctomycetota bacterium]
MKIGSGFKSAGLSSAAFLCGIFGMIILMASRRSGSLLTLDYFLYVFQYVCVITMPMAISQFFAHRYQFRNGVTIEWLAILMVSYTIAHAVVGYSAASAFDF